MWILVSFDLPTFNTEERKNADRFRKTLLKDGFSMFQFSIYIRHCMSRENAKVHTERIKAVLPPEGQVAIFSITDKQFGMMERFFGSLPTENEKPPEQLTIF